MPRFSVIVPAYKVQAYLQESLDSVLTQSYPDLELIAVDDASPDACGSIIDEYAARDPRVTAVHLAHNLGLGPARNAGLVRATGDYLIFLDGDDTLAPGALQALTDRLKATGSPDVLVYDYARAYWSGELVRNRLSHRLSEEGPASFRLADRPALLAMLMVVWNKAYRREYIEREGLEFPPGLYEDTPWTYPAMLAAESVAVLDRVCVHYRQRRTGSILTTSTPATWRSSTSTSGSSATSPDGPSWSAGAPPCTAGWPSTSAPSTPTPAASRAPAGPSSSPGPPPCCAATAPRAPGVRCRCPCRGPTGSGTR